MKQKKRWFEIYPDNTLATNLSVAGGAVRLLAVLLTVAAAPMALLTVVICVRFALLGNLSSGLLYLLDELDGELAGGFFLVVLACGAWYAACVLRRKAESLVAPRETSLALPSEEQIQ